MPGSGSGFPGTGSGSGMPPMPPTGSGSGMPPMPPTGSGSGYPGGSGMPGGGYGSECAPGFLKVCPEIDYTCPMDSMPVCPAPMTMPMGRSLDRMMVLMQMVMTQQEVMGRSMERASGDTFEDESVKV